MRRVTVFRHKNRRVSTHRSVYHIKKANMKTGLGTMLLVGFCTASSVPFRVEWFGDGRGEGDVDAFYDLNYSDSACDGELSGQAVGHYVFLGPVLSALSVDYSADCLQECYQNPSCRAVNFYPAGVYRKKAAFCELLDRPQIHAPQWMRRFSGAVYYEDIRCRSYRTAKPVQRAGPPSTLLRKALNKLSQGRTLYP